MTLPSTTTRAIEVRTCHGGQIEAALPRWEAFIEQRAGLPLSYHPRWLAVLAEGLGHKPYGLEAVEGDRIVGLLPLAFLDTPLFGRYLVGLPYLNHGGVVADSEEAAHLLIDAAVALADRLHVRFLELRHDREIPHRSLVPHPASKVHMRLALPGDAGALWDALTPKVRNQVRKARKGGLTTSWGGAELLSDFYAVFSRNMRDLGTPVYGRGLFRAVLQRFAGQAELGVVQADDRPIAAGLLLHGAGVTEIPSAGSLRQFNSSCANMLLYWSAIERATRLGQPVFDFGRSTPDGPVFRFKKQWGATPSPTRWQTYTRVGDASAMRPENPRFRQLIRAWQRLPVPLTRWIGPALVRGIP